MELIAGVLGYGALSAGIAMFLTCPSWIVGKVVAHASKNPWKPSMATATRPRRWALWLLSSGGTFVVITHAVTTAAYLWFLVATGSAIVAHYAAYMIARAATRGWRLHHQPRVPRYTPPAPLPDPTRTAPGPLPDPTWFDRERDNIDAWAHREAE